MASCNGVSLKDGAVRYKREEFPVAGVSARVESEASSHRKMTATRLLTGGVLLGGRKKVDEREAYLVVDGPEFQWQVPLRMTKNPKNNRMLEEKARKFAAKITTAGRRD